MRKSMVINILLVSVFTMLFSSCSETSENKNVVENGTKSEKVSNLGSNELTYKLVDTNIGTCYNGVNEIDCPSEGEAFYGQDAQFTGNIPSYTDNGDGTIDDNVTGLVWAQSVSTYSMSWKDANVYCEDLELGGNDNWRLPSVKELWSIRDFSVGWPRVDTDYFYLVGDGSEMAQHHSRTSNLYLVESEYQNDQVVGDPAFIVNDWTGHIKAMSGERFVRCVSGGEYGINKFVDNGDGTVSDEATGLMWAQNDNGESLTWEEALAYANESELGGYDDWRVPNIKELQSIVDYSGVFPPMDNNMFNTTQVINELGQEDYPYYWSSTFRQSGKGLSSSSESESDSEEKSDSDSHKGSSKTYIWFQAIGYNKDHEGYDLHGAGSVCFTPMESSNHTFVRLVRGGDLTETPEGDTSVIDYDRVTEFEDGITTRGGSRGGSRPESGDDSTTSEEDRPSREDRPESSEDRPDREE